MSTKSVKDIWNVTKSATFRTVNMVDNLTEMGERASADVNQRHADYVKVEQLKRQKEQEALAAELGLSPKEAKEFFAA
ncbi:hypothetical protein [Marinobacter shengliensis]|uniref:hypothetical protein n=1 Tax=Marinobacter shengliensis TaxID=1389223 RepID=UPI001E3EC24E|nr:hypothetical protein [Marinobacter shengliensis]MCD1628478.1 hypothetical protein [Marinobacter shengliensis]